MRPRISKPAGAMPRAGRLRTRARFRIEEGIREMLAGMARAHGIALALLFLNACATAGASSFDAMRADYDRAGPTSPAARADDERVLETSALDRPSYVRAVLQRNPTIESARHGWRAAIARIKQAGSFEDPMVDLSVAPLSIGSSSVRTGYEVGISQKLPWFGKRNLESAVASAEAGAAKSDFEATRRELALTASVLYDQYFVAVRSQEINAQHIALVRTLRAGATAQFEAGRASVQDPLQAEAELTHLEHDAVILTSQREVIVAQMNELLHRDPELPLPPPKDLPLPSGDVHDAKRLQAEALERRPDIESARLHARAEQARADKSDREYYPDFTVSTSYNSMWDMPEHRWMVGLGFNLPIQVGRRAAMVDEANAARQRFESEAVRLSDMARTQVVVALKQLEESKHVLHLFEERLLPVARNQVDAARAGFIASQNPFVAVIDAEKNLRSVELDYQMARATCDRRRAELDRALGRIPGLDGKDAKDAKEVAR
ncbi:TolC family protein [Pendulispora brunnea]|uniref:TolC family protein n=1 Tax=Pendulispora brunnea TaxID=2905690 RepID=A0ABZ2KBW9_9BACT